MRRRSRGLLGVATVVLLAACGSDATVAQPEDDFLDKVEAECRIAAKGIGKLDITNPDSGEIGTYTDLLATTVDAFKDLEPPTTLKKDFDNLVSNLDDQVAEGDRLAQAIESDDTAAATASIATLIELGVDTDRSAQALGALACQSLAPDETTFDTTPESTPDFPTTTVTTTVETTVETTTVDTAAETTTPDTSTGTTVEATTTTTGDEIFPTELKATAIAPDGYFWVDDYVQSDAAGLFDKSVLGPLITEYSAGRVENVADGHTASIFVLTLNSDWTQPAIDQYLFWEGVSEGTDVVTPGGIPVRQKTAAFEETDCLAYYAARTGIAICTFTGIDGLAILDAFVAAQPG